MLVGYFTLPLDEFGPERPVLSWTTMVVALVVLSLLLVREIQRLLVNARHGRPAFGILVLVCLSLVIFASSYYALARHHGEFNGLHTRLDALYFTVITVSTVGFGDIAPAGQAARAVVIVQIGYNFVFLAAAASALSAQLRGRAVERAHSPRPRRRRKSGNPDEPGEARTRTGKPGQGR
ncbi:two pore domain potassium channel family protein [Streptacidiphilus sp. P02-A3a]|nr:two pore domain potassium channel family protein [Streptacidiphilus sp. P02-A3a]